MRVLYVAAEAAPIVKVGGLGDVAGSLPPALKKLGVDIRIAIPWYEEIDPRKWQVRERDGVGETKLGESEIPVYLIAREVFAGTGIHQAIVGTAQEERWFSGFCERVVEFVDRSSWKPEVFHGNDWHVSEALVRLGADRSIGTLLTIHNLSYHPKVLRQGILAARVINAVSPNYAKEILTAEFCEGLCEELRSRKADLVGVLNGIDYSYWDPKADPRLDVTYDSQTWQEGKRRNKATLISELGLSSTDRILLGFVGRLDPHQKGVLVFANAIERLVAQGAQIVVLGTGERRSERIIATLCSRFPGSTAAVIRFDEALAHRIYAGADALLIPSRFEPCGLIQMIAMRYGTLPIAHAVGGLRDTIRDGETGFLYEDYSSRGLVRAVTRSHGVFRDESHRWVEMIRRAMGEDFSWERSARAYLKLYEKARALL